MDEARANAAQIPERSAGAPAVTLPASLPDDVVRAICTYLEGHRGAARRLTLADGQTKWWIRDGIHDLRDELLPPLRPFAIKISLVPRDAADQGNEEHIKVAEATVRAYLATILK